MVMLMLALALMYQAMLVWHRHGNRPVILATVEGERWNGKELIWKRSIQEISERLNISQRTVKYHISNLFQKTDVKTQKELKRTLRKQKRRFEKGLDPLPPDEYEEDE